MHTLHKYSLLQDYVIHKYVIIRLIYHTIVDFSVCVAGHFGSNCASTCSGNCVNDEHCNHITGNCDNGCKDGYYETNNCSMGNLQIYQRVSILSFKQTSSMQFGKGICSVCKRLNKLFQGHD